jgi:hypothetical protein
MKIQNRLRMQAVILGVGAALLLASSVRAQEIENTSFDDGPNVIAFEQQQAPAPTATNQAAAAINSTTTAAPILTQEAAVSALAPVQLSLLAFLVVCIGLYAAHGMVEAKRLRRNLMPRNGSQQHS